MPNIIFTLNAKGGVGKTTMAVNLAAQFGQKNKFNLIGADIQVSASLWTGQNYN
ncbi:MAG: ParA family protein [Nodularia sp. (in: Bacteria)]|nr:MAG: ParA family protein [Nodularia sp. (in: cyanobacteria)]